ncbi:MAG: hypothetical protein II306_06460 [Clostridia bacterium]|nr:hypothetical protein [Clostridia bacterium]
MATADFIKFSLYSNHYIFRANALFFENEVGAKSACVEQDDSTTQPLFQISDLTGGYRISNGKENIMFKKMQNKVKEIFNRMENRRLTDDFNDAVRFKRSVNMEISLHILINYLIQDQLTRTGILYSGNDNYILAKAQHLFWEWKNEGIIDEFNDFNDATKNWITAYA